MHAQQIDRLQATNTENEATGKAFFFTGIALLVINGIITIAVGKAQILMSILPLCVVFAAVGGGLWVRAMKARQQD